LHPTTHPIAATQAARFHDIIPRAFSQQRPGQQKYGGGAFLLEMVRGGELSGRYMDDEGTMTL
jgi:hypothetical protein